MNNLLERGPLTYSQARDLCKPYLTESNAKVFANQTDKLLWIEHNILDQIGVGSICNWFGYTIAEFCELEFDDLNELKES